MTAQCVVCWQHYSRKLESWDKQAIKIQRFRPKAPQIENLYYVLGTMAFCEKHYKEALELLRFQYDAEEDQIPI